MDGPRQHKGPHARVGVHGIGDGAPTGPNSCKCGHRRGHLAALWLAVPYQSIM